MAALPGGLLASGGKDKTVRLWVAATGAPVATLEGHGKMVTALAALPEGRLASGSDDATIRLWSVAARACTQVLQLPSGVKALAVLDGGRLASGCRDSKIHVWAPSGDTFVEEPPLEGHTQDVVSLAALPRGLLASGSVDRTARVWDVGSRTCVVVLGEHGGEVSALAALPDGRLASGSLDDPFVRVWALTAPDSPEDAAAAMQASGPAKAVKPGPEKTAKA